jgi:hypothetical protein
MTVKEGGKVHAGGDFGMESPREGKDHHKEIKRCGPTG